MFFYLRLFFLLVFCLGIVIPGVAQQDTIPPARIIVKVNMLPLFMKGYVLEVEKGITADARQSLLIAPAFYQGSTSFADSWSSREQREDGKGDMLGYGADIQHRFYFRNNPEALPGRPYISYGLSYHHFKVNFEEAMWLEETGEDGLLYYRNRVLPFTEKINRWGVSTLIGMQGPYLSDKIIADMYVGLGYDYSSSTSEFTAIRYNTSVFDFGFTGIRPLFGAKFGIVF